MQSLIVGCESCGCNVDFAIGGTCSQETGQCVCLPGVIGQNCSHCPMDWVLVTNETRTTVTTVRKYILVYINKKWPNTLTQGV